MEAGPPSDSGCTRASGKAASSTLSCISIFFIFTAVLSTAEKQFREDPAVVADLVNIDFVPAPGFGEEERGESPRSTELFSMLYADCAGIVARTSANLAKIMTAIVEKCDALGLTESEKKMETMVLHPPGEPAQQLMIQAARQRNVQKERFMYLGGTSARTPTCQLNSRAALEARGVLSTDTTGSCTTERPRWCR